MTGDIYTIHADGGSRGNPGPAAYGFVLRGPGIAEVAAGRAIGTATNNVAEYMAVIEGLKKLKALLGTEKAAMSSVQVRADSELVVRQANRQYKVKDPNLKKLFVDLHNACMDFSSVSFTHIPREQNAAADRMVNEALDGEQKGLGL